MPDFLSFPFMQRAIAAALLVGFTASYYGVFVVQRRLSFLGNGLAHAAFGGVALGMLLHAEPLIIAVPFTVIVALLVVWLKEKTRIESDTSIGILFSASVALGIIFLSLKTDYAADAFTYLFGSILSVFPSDIIAISLLAATTMIFHFTHWHRWAYATFDRELAKSDKLNVAADDYVLFVLLAVTIVIAIKIVGIILISAFLVIPAAISKVTARTFSGMTIVSVAAGTSTAVCGLIVSYYIDMPSGAVIILLQTLVFAIAALLGRKRG